MDGGVPSGATAPPAYLPTAMPAANVAKSTVARPIEAAVAPIGIVGNHSHKLTVLLLPSGSVMRTSSRST